MTGGPSQGDDRKYEQYLYTLQADKDLELYAPMTRRR
jgi:hypothetical protein